MVIRYARTLAAHNMRMRTDPRRSTRTPASKRWSTSTRPTRQRRSPRTLPTVASRLGPHRSLLLLPLSVRQDFSNLQHRLRRRSRIVLRCKRRRVRLGLHLRTGSRCHARRCSSARWLHPAHSRNLPQSWSCFHRRRNHDRYGPHRKTLRSESLECRTRSDPRRQRRRQRLRATRSRSNFRACCRSFHKRFGRFPTRVHLPGPSRFHRRRKRRSRHSRRANSLCSRRVCRKNSTRVSRATRRSPKRRRNSWTWTFAWNRIRQKQIHTRTVSQRTKYRRKNPPRPPTVSGRARPRSR